jgi:hypothetical protein
VPGICIVVGVQLVVPGAQVITVVVVVVELPPPPPPPLLFPLFELPPFGFSVG